MNIEHHPTIIEYIKLNHFGKLLGMDFTILEKGKVEYSMTISEKHLATPIAAHGGSVAGLLDAAIGVGALTLVCEENRVVSTVEMKLTFFAPALLNDVLIATSVALKTGKRLIFMEAEVRNQRNELVAKASGTLNAYPKEKAGY